MIRRVFIPTVSLNPKIRENGGGLDAISGRSLFPFEEEVVIAIK